jgi:hypothetical protein
LYKAEQRRNKLQEQDGMNKLHRKEPGKINEDKYSKNQEKKRKYDPDLLQEGLLHPMKA